MTKILLKGYYGFGNLGDDILMIVSYKLLKKKFPDAEFFIFSNNTKNLQGFANNDQYNHYIFDLLDAKPILIDWTHQGYFDLIFNGGGGVYFDDRHGPWIFSVINWMCKAIGVKRLYRITEFFRKLMNKPNRIESQNQVGFGIGIGPYSINSTLLWRHLADIGRHETLFVRDEKSAQFLSQIGFDGNTLKGTDIAFLSDYWNELSPTLNSNKKFGGKLCVVLQDWPANKEEKFKTIIELVNTVQAEKITFLSFDKNQDKDYAKLFSNKFNFIAWDPERMKLAEFLNVIASHDAVITGRAHGAIVGAIAGVIPICLGTSQKLIEVSKFFPSGGILTSDNFTVEELAKCWNQVGKNYEKLLMGLMLDVKANEVIAQRTKEKLFEVL